jgi:hypothetical protein
MWVKENPTLSRMSMLAYMKVLISVMLGISNSSVIVIYKANAICQIVPLRAIGTKFSKPIIIFDASSFSHG